MKITKGEIVIWAVVLVSFLLSIYFYPRMPERMASHWNGRGQVDSYLPKGICLFITPSIIAVIALITSTLARLEMIKEKIEPYRKYYDGFAICLGLFFLATDYWMILWNLGIKVGPNIVFPWGIGLIIFYIGMICKKIKIKPNFIIGIRTPWTMNNETVWNKTNRFGGNMFMLSGVFTLGGIFFPDYVLYWIIIPIFAAVAIILVYSYLVYHGEMQKEKYSSTENLTPSTMTSSPGQNIFLQKHSSFTIEAMTLIIILIYAAFMVPFIVITKACTFLIVILGFSGLLILLLMATYMGGLIYQIVYGKLIVKSGLLKITLERIPLEIISDLEPTNYSVFKSMAWGWYNKFPDGSRGYVRRFKGKAVKIYTNQQKYLLASEDPKNLIAQIRKYME